MGIYGLRAMEDMRMVACWPFCAQVGNVRYWETRRAVQGRLLPAGAGVWTSGPIRRLTAADSTGQRRFTTARSRTEKRRSSMML